MWLKNNSSNEWLNYDCGSCVIDIHPHAELEVPESVGLYILKRLGHANWIVKMKEAPVQSEVQKTVIEEKVVEEVKSPKKPKSKKTKKTKVAKK
jgi:hypothetical protein